MSNRNEVESFYNDFSVHQKKMGINKRHISIFKNLKAAGLKRNHSVLEIGCGIGTLTSLIYKYLSKSSYIQAFDISQRNIDIAKNVFKKHNNIEFICEDVNDSTISGQFDVVVMPDVLEHIPVNHHNNIFQKLHKVLNRDGFILINIPTPDLLDWVREHNPEELQIIDQSLSLSHFDCLAKNSGFKVLSISNYGIWRQAFEYQSLIFVKDKHGKEFELKEEERHKIQNIKLYFASLLKRLL